MERTGASEERAFQNETQLGADGAIASVALPNRQIINFGFSTNNGTTLSQTGNGQYSFVGIALYVPSLCTVSMHQQYQDSLEQFFLDLGISSPLV